LSGEDLNYSINYIKKQTKILLISLALFTELISRYITMERLTPPFFSHFAINRVKDQDDRDIRAAQRLSK